MSSPCCKGCDTDFCTFVCPCWLLEEIGQMTHALQTHLEYLFGRTSSSRSCSVSEEGREQLWSLVFSHGFVHSSIGIAGTILFLVSLSIVFFNKFLPLGEIQADCGR